MLANMVISWAVNHQQYLEGVASGYVAAHAVQLAPQAAAFAFHQAMRIPWIRAGIVKNPERAKKIIKAIEQELEKDIDTEAAADKAATQPPTQ